MKFVTTILNTLKTNKLPRPLGRWGYGEMYYSNG